MKRIPLFLILLLTGLGVTLATWLISTGEQKPSEQPEQASALKLSPATMPYSAAPQSTAPTLAVTEGQGEGWDGSTPEPSGNRPSNLSTAHADQLQPDDQDRINAIGIAKQFVDGWSDPTDARQDKLVDITHPSLYNELIDIPPNRRITAQPNGEPTIIEHSANRIIVEQALHDRDTIWILLTDDPTSPQGWYVVAVEPEPAA